MDNRYIDAAERIKSSLGAADTAIILGSGLGGLSAHLENAASLSYSEIPGFPVSTAPGHAGRIYCGFIGTKAVYCLRDVSTIMKAIHRIRSFLQ